MKRRLTSQDLLTEETVKKVDQKMFHFHLGRTNNSKASVPVKAFRRFRVLDRILGKGSFSTVFLASRNDQLVALKIQFNDEQFRFEQKLTHKMSKWKLGPQVLESWITDGYGFIALEYWNGSMLDLDLKELPQKLTAKLRGLIEEMHRLGYVHADVLPKNILVRTTQEGIPCDITLCDFGLAQFVEDFQLTRALPEEDETRRGYMSTLFHYHMLEDNLSHEYFRRRKIQLRHCLNNPRHLDYGFLFYLEKGKGVYPSLLANSSDSRPQNELL